MTRRRAAEWGVAGVDDDVEVDVLVPTCGRPTELAATLAGLAAQDEPSFRVVVSDQSDDGASIGHPAVRSMARVLRAQGCDVRLLRHLPRRGLAGHRHHLVGAATSPYLLFLDDDVWLEPGAVRTMHAELGRLGCGFVGMAVQGLSYLADRRPGEWVPFQRWDGDVGPDRVRRGTPAFERWTLHNAANLVHLAGELGLRADDVVPYRVAWIGACVMYRTDAVLACGGFAFWDSLPAHHSGEEVALQWRLMERWGGAGLIPSAAVHLETPTTVPVRRVDAQDVVLE